MNDCASWNIRHNPGSVQVFIEGVFVMIVLFLLITIALLNHPIIT